MTREEVITTLKEYKRLIAIQESLLNDYDGILQAQVLSDMPKGNGIHSQTETAMLKAQNELKELQKEIKRVHIWLNYLNEEEKFITEQIYFEERYISLASNKWCNMGNEYHSSGYWKNKHKSAIKKITQLSTKLVPI